MSVSEIFTGDVGACRSTSPVGETVSPPGVDEPMVGLLDNKSVESGSGWLAAVGLAAGVSVYCGPNLSQGVEGSVSNDGREGRQSFGEVVSKTSGQLRASGCRSLGKTACHVLHSCDDKFFIKAEMASALAPVVTVDLVHLVLAADRWSHPQRA